MAPEIKALRAELLEGVPDDRETADAGGASRVLMADLLEYHRREEKPGWWRYFHLLGLTDEQLMDESDAIAGLEFVGMPALRRSRVV